MFKTVQPVNAQNVSQNAKYSNPDVTRALVDFYQGYSEKIKESLSNNVMKMLEFSRSLTDLEYVLELRDMSFADRPEALSLVQCFISYNIGVIAVDDSTFESLSKLKGSVKETLMIDNKFLTTMYVEADNKIVLKESNILAFISDDPFIMDTMEDHDNLSITAPEFINMLLHFIDLAQKAEYPVTGDKSIFKLEQVMYRLINSNQTITPLYVDSKEYNRFKYRMPAMSVICDKSFQVGNSIVRILVVRNYGQFATAYFTIS